LGRLVLKNEEKTKKYLSQKIKLLGRKYLEILLVNWMMAHALILEVNT